MYFFNMENYAITTKKKKKNSCCPRPQLKSQVHNRVTHVPQCHNRDAVVSASKGQGSQVRFRRSREDGHWCHHQRFIVSPSTAGSPGRACPQVTAPAVWGIWITKGLSGRADSNLPVVTSRVCAIQFMLCHCRALTSFSGNPRHREEQLFFVTTE